MQRPLRLSIAPTLLLVLLAACGEGPNPTPTRIVRNNGFPPSAAPALPLRLQRTAEPRAAAPWTPASRPRPPPTANPSGIFPPDNVWNTRIDDAAVDPRSDAYIAAMGADDPLVASWTAEGDGLPYVEVGNDQAKVPVHFWGFPDESDPGPYPIPWDAPTDRSTDHHVIVVDRANGWLYELFGASRNADGSWDASNGAKWNLRTNDRRPDRWTSADAAGMPIFPGIVRWDEVDAGWIGHALRFAVNRSQRGYVWPASHAAGSCDLGTDCPPMGLRVRLKKSVDLSRFPPRMQVVLRALQQYGMFVADNSGGPSWWLAGAPDARWSDEENLTLGALKGRDFEVVAHGDIQPQ